MKKVVVSGIIGNGLEWYDYALYAHFATIISKHFFPTGDSFTSLIATFGVFAAGFFMRPLGAILFGYIGDRFGRRASLASAILLMAVPTACIGLLPTFEQIGILAPILLTVIRLLQGLSLGGGFSGFIAFVVEHSPAEHRGLAGSTSMFSMCLGIVVGSAVAAFMSNVMPTADLELWGWRVPFILGLIVGVVGLYIRAHTDESPHYVEAKEQGSLSEQPVRDVFAHYLPTLVLGISIYLTVTIPFYTFVVFLNNYMTEILHRPIDESLTINTISMVVVILLLPVGGWLSDKIGRKPLLVGAAVGYLLLAYPIFTLLAQPDYYSPLIGQILFGVLVAMYMGPVPAVLVELFPTSVRYTGVALSYNISAAVFGGTMPMISTWLIKITGTGYSVAYYIMFFAALTLVSLYYWKDRCKLQLA